jgi:hypothetical protein
MRTAIQSLVIATLLIATAQRLPAPIQEVPDTPSPRPKAKPSVQPKAEDAKKRNVVRPTPTPALLFAGTWLGISGELRGRTVTVNPTETSVSIDGGPWGRESGSVEANGGGQLIWTTSPLSVRVKWTLSLAPGGKTAQLTNKHFLGSESGTFEKKN